MDVVLFENVMPKLQRMDKREFWFMRYIYHGSKEIVPVPVFGKGRPDNDYGTGFYCTEDIELAKEWAAVDEKGGFLNCYEVDETDMLRFDLILSEQKDSSAQILQWLAVLLANRNIRLGSPVEKRGREYILAHFLPDLSDADFLVGYRADDSYFSFARAFLSNTITLGQLSHAMFFGELGLQYVIKSRRMFTRIHFLEAVPVDGELYYPKRRKRDLAAREKYRKMLEQESEDGFYLNQIMREK